MDWTASNCRWVALVLNSDLLKINSLQAESDDIRGKGFNPALPLNFHLNFKINDGEWENMFTNGTIQQSETV